MAENEQESPESNEEESRDPIDLALSALVDKLVPEDASDEEWDDLSDTLFDVIGDLADDGKIGDIPPEDADDSVKQEWLDGSLSIIAAELELATHEDDDVDSDLE